LAVAPTNAVLSLSVPPAVTESAESWEAMVGSFAITVTGPAPHLLETTLPLD
jgi:hypothetical protein